MQELAAKLEIRGVMNKKENNLTEDVLNLVRTISKLLQKLCVDDTLILYIWRVPREMMQICMH